MKIRLDHITNSSSSGFIISLHKGEIESFEDYMNELNQHEDAQNEGVRIYVIAKTIEQLNEYVDERPADWITKATAVQIDNMSESNYKLCKEIIKEGGIAVECWVDYNVTEKFCDDYEEHILENFS